MVSSSRQAIACILLIFSASTYARTQSAAEKGVASTIAGKVTVKDKGVPGIGVSLTLIEGSNASTTRHRVVTDDEGNYRLTNVPPGSYGVTITAPAFASVDRLGTQKNVIVNKGETVDNVDFALVRGGVITGRVTDSDGRPVIEEEIYILPVKMEDPHRYFRMPSGRTDDRGVYRVFGLHAGSYRVAAGEDEAGGFGGMRGRALYNRTFYANAAEASAATVIELKEGGEVTGVDITVGRSIAKYSASGRIIDGETGRPLADVPYGVQMFINPNSSSSTIGGVVSNSEGEFKLHNLAPGKYAVFVETPPNSEWRADPVHFEVTDQNVTGLTMKTTRGASASGVIILEGTNDKAIYAKLLKVPLHAHVMNDRPDRVGTSPRASVNPDGSFRVGGLQAGVLSFGSYPHERLKMVRIEREGVVYPRGVEIKESEQLTGLRVIFNYANGTIRGVVKLEKGSLPPDAQLNISLRRVAESDLGPYVYDDQPQLDARGQFVAEGLLPGTYEVSASYAPDLRTPWRRATQQVVVSNGAVTNITLTIDPDAPVPPRP